MDESAPRHDTERTFPLVTLCAEAVFEGLGLHGGAPVTVRARPGDAGIRFLTGGERVEARPEQVTGVSRCTRLGPVATVEHLMSAFAALGVTDAEVEVSGPELPALDGSSLPYVEGLEAAGLQEIGQATIEGPFARVFEKRGGAEIAIGRGEGRWRYVFDLGDRWMREQAFEIALSPGAYRASVAPARTIAFEEQVEEARAAGLGLGLDAESVVLIGQRGYGNAPRFDDEPARHKLLDMIGDLYLAGVPPVMLNVAGARNGHAANVRAAAKLAQAVRVSRLLT
jgi:UDP-3-O-acyl-N-acetylglucosamine deacetylase